MSLKERDLKCVNHVNVSGDVKAGEYGKLMKYVLTLPLVIWHQVVCVDNPILHATSNRLYKQFWYNKDWYKESIKQVQIKTIKLREVITEKLP